MLALQEAVTEQRANDHQLIELVWQLRTQPEKLDALESQLRQEALYDEALHRLLEQRLTHCWFIAFKYQQPRELLCAYEYDYFARATESTKRSELLQLLHKAHDEALSLRYFGLYGIVQFADRQAWGVRLFAELMRPGDRVETLLCAPDDERLSFDDALLNPPLARYAEWTCFHVQMRRTAFLLMQKLLVWLDTFYAALGRVDFTMRGTLIDVAILVARHWRTKMWRDPRGDLVPLAEMQRQSAESLATERAVDFLALPDDALAEHVAGIPGWISSAKWRHMTQDAWELATQALPQSGRRIFLSTVLQDAHLDRECIAPPGAYDFIYDATSAKSRAAFRARVLEQ
jgi:hypothetical protein